MCFTYALQYYDKALLSQAAIFGLRDDLGLEDGLRYSWVSLIFYFGYMAGCYPVCHLDRPLAPALNFIDILANADILCPCRLSDHLLPMGRGSPLHSSMHKLRRNPRQPLHVGCHRERRLPRLHALHRNVVHPLRTSSPLLAMVLLQRRFEHCLPSHQLWPRPHQGADPCIPGNTCTSSPASQPSSGL